MLRDFLSYFAATDPRIEGDELVLDERRIPIRNRIPRFSDDSYSAGNFSLLRERHATLQLDSVNGTTDRMNTFLDRTGWRAESLQGNGGDAFVQSYSRDWFQMLRWKYLLRPVTRRMEQQTLYRLIQRCTPVLYPLTTWLNKNRVTRILCWFVVPYINHRHRAKYANLSDAYMREYAVHETSDALSPRYDNPLSTRTMDEIAGRRLDRPFEIIHGRGFVLLAPSQGGKLNSMIGMQLMPTRSL